MFGRNREIEKLREEIAYLKGMLSTIQNQPTRIKQVEEELEPEIKSSWSKLKKRVEDADKLSIIKKIEKIEKRLGINKTPNDESDSIQLDPSEPASIENLDIESILRNPIIKMAINTFLKQYGTSIDDIRNDPSKLIEILEDITNKMKQKKSESEKQGLPFNPYDPMLFMRGRD